MSTLKFRRLALALTRRQLIQWFGMSAVGVLGCVPLSSYQVRAGRDGPDFKNWGQSDITLGLLQVPFANLPD